MQEVYFRMSPGVQVALDSNSEVRRGGLLEAEDGIDIWEKGQEILFSM